MNPLVCIILVVLAICAATALVIWRQHRTRVYALRQRAKHIDRLARLGEPSTAQLMSGAEQTRERQLLARIYNESTNAPARSYAGAEDETRVLPALTQPLPPEGTPMARINHDDLEDDADRGPLTGPTIMSERLVDAEVRKQEGDEPGLLASLAAPPAAPSYSVNDFAKWREQDQAVAQCTSQLADMEGNPWKAYELEATEARAPLSSEHWVGNYLDRRNQPVTNMAGQLSALSAPIATYRSVRESGFKYSYVSVGNRIIAGADPKTMDELNGGVINVTAPLRKRILAELHAMAQGGKLPEQASSRKWVAAAGVQNVLFCDSEEEAKEYAAKLNQAYHDACEPWRQLVLKELAKVTEVGVAATLDHTIGANDRRLPDFRERG